MSAPTAQVDAPATSVAEPAPVAAERAPKPDPEESDGATARGMAPSPAPASGEDGKNVPSSPSVARSNSSKSKKKKPVVTMATAAAAAHGGSTGAQGENTGRWTAEEHRLFLQGLELHGKGWKKIASLIKSRTVVQIRTHAQKYFQKLAKARQNGEEGEIAMDSRGGAASVTAVSPAAAVQNGKRRRHSTGTKRKVIQSVVASAQMHGKKYGVCGPDGTPIPTAAPALAHFVLPVAPSQGTNKSCVPSITTAQGTISGPALEDSLFRFLSPAPVASEPQVNEVARAAGANPIALPTDSPTAQGSGNPPDIGSPTGVTELSVYPSWTDAKDTPSWYSKGADVDALLEVGDALDWLADSGDLHESYQPPAVDSAPCMPDMVEHGKAGDGHNAAAESSKDHDFEPTDAADMDVSALPTVDANNVDSIVPQLPSLFDGSTDDIAESMKKMHPGSHSEVNMEKSMSHHSIDDHLQVFDTPMDEHDFVSTILENSEESHGDLEALAHHD